MPDPAAATPESAPPQDSASPNTDSVRPDGTSPTSGSADPTDDVAALGYEQARDELVDIVARLENGQAGLEESMRLWERAEALAAHCSRWLDRAEKRIATTDE